MTCIRKGKGTQQTVLILNRNGAELNEHYYLFNSQRNFKLHSSLFSAFRPLQPYLFLHFSFFTFHASLSHFILLLHTYTPSYSFTPHPTPPFHTILLLHTSSYYFTLHPIPTHSILFRLYSSPSLLFLILHASTYSFPISILLLRK